MPAEVLLGLVTFAAFALDHPFVSMLSFLDDHCFGAEFLRLVAGVHFMVLPPRWVVVIDMPLSNPWLVVIDMPFADPWLVVVTLGAVEFITNNHAEDTTHRRTNQCRLGVAANALAKESAAAAADQQSVECPITRLGGGKVYRNQKNCCHCQDDLVHAVLHRLNEILPAVVSLVRQVTFNRKRTSGDIGPAVTRHRVDVHVMSGGYPGRIAFLGRLVAGKKGGSAVVDNYGRMITSVNWPLPGWR